MRWRKTGRQRCLNSPCASATWLRRGAHATRPQGLQFVQHAAVLAPLLLRGFLLGRLRRGALRACVGVDLRALRPTLLADVGLLPLVPDLHQAVLLLAAC